MTKTPEELAIEHAAKLEGIYKDGSPVAHEAVGTFLAGYEAGRASEASREPTCGAKWISVKERLPEKDKLVLVKCSKEFFGFNLISTCLVDLHGGCPIFADRYLNGHVTHWLDNVPALPGEGEK